MCSQPLRGPLFFITTPLSSTCTPVNPFYLLGNPLPFLCCGANAGPLLTLVGVKLNPLTLPTSPFPLNGPPKFMLHALLRRHYNIGCAQSDTVPSKFTHSLLAVPICVRILWLDQQHRHIANVYFITQTMMRSSEVFHWSFVHRHCRIFLIVFRLLMTRHL